MLNTQSSFEPLTTQQTQLNEGSDDIIQNSSSQEQGNIGTLEYSEQQFKRGYWAPTNEETFSEYPSNNEERKQVIIPEPIVGVNRRLRKVKNYPEETKNFPKNMGHRLQQFIINSFHDIEQVRDDRIIQKFLERPPKSIIKGHLNELKQSFYGAQILRFFFADYVWAADCIVKNKMELTQTLIINQMWCDEL